MEISQLSQTLPQRQQRQVVEAVLDYAASKRIPVGGRLPTIRAISEDTGISPATVGKALKQLALQGVVEARGRHGTFLTRQLTRPKRKPVQQIIIIYGLGGNISQSIMGGIQDFGLRTALKDLRPNVDVYSLIYSGDEGHENDDYLEKLVRFHSQVGRSDGIVFLLCNCNRDVKEFFSTRGVPAIIMGGNEGIDLPSVSGDMNGIVENVFDILEAGNAMPAALIRDCRVPFGNQKDMFRNFENESKKRGFSDGEFTIWDAHETPEMFRALFTALLRENNKIRTFITRADDVATWAMRVCIELGLQKEVRLISLGGSLLGEWYFPTITGMYYDVYAAGEIILSLSDTLCNGEKPEQMTHLSKTVMVFRESFPNPHLVSEHIYSLARSAPLSRLANTH